MMGTSRTQDLEVAGHPVSQSERRIMTMFSSHFRIEAWGAGSPCLRVDLPTTVNLIKVIDTRTPRG